MIGARAGNSFLHPYTKLYELENSIAIKLWSQFLCYVSMRLVIYIFFRFWIRGGCRRAHAVTATQHQLPPHIIIVCRSAVNAHLLSHWYFRERARQRCYLKIKIKIICIGICNHISLRSFVFIYFLDEWIFAERKKESQFFFLSQTPTAHRVRMRI